MTTAFTIEPVYYGDRALLILSGELDATCAHRLQPTVNIMRTDGCRHLTLDVTALRFCDSAGLRALILAHTSMATAGGAMKLIGVQDQLRRILTLTGMDQMFTISPRYDEDPAAAAD